MTSPPYYALRDYGKENQIGREGAPEEYIGHLVSVFCELKRVLRSDGTFWLNIADCYSRKSYHGLSGCKPKELMGLPWLLALTLRKEGWFLRSDIIWQKDNPMPESAKDRPSRCYEHIFLLTKSGKYFYDNLAVAEPIALSTAIRYRYGRKENTKYADGIPGQMSRQQINNPCRYGKTEINPLRNKRDVWNINTVPYKGAHFAAFPPRLAETCILAGCPKQGIVLDPFMGSGTTGAVAKGLNRQYIGIELNEEYCRLAEERIKKILAAVELILKLALMVLSLNLILLSAFSALGLNGMRSAFLPGFLVSIDVCAVLLFLKIWLMPEPRKGILKFASTRNVVLLFLFMGVLSGIFCCLAVLSAERHYPFFRQMPETLRSGVAAGRLVPESASDITIHESPVSPQVIEWRCRLAEREFLDFAAANNWRPEPETDLFPLFRRYCREMRRPDGAIFFTKRSGNGGGIFVMYDPGTQTMYGQVSLR